MLARGRGRQIIQACNAVADARRRQSFDHRVASERCEFVCNIAAPEAVDDGLGGGGRHTRTVPFLVTAQAGKFMQPQALFP